METARPAHLRRARRALFVCVTALVVTSAPAAAAVTVALTGPATASTLTVTGTGPGEESPQFKYIPASGNNSHIGYTQIYVPAPDTLATAPQGAPYYCANTNFSSGGSGTSDSHTISCPDGDGANVGIANLVVNTGPGADSPVLQECFSSTQINLGDGDNTFLVPACSSPNPLSFTSGSGSDTLSYAAGEDLTVNASLGGGDDLNSPNPTAEGPMTVDGGPGNDRLDGGLGSDTLLGGDGNDLLSGGPGPGSDKLDGGAGDDQFDVNGNHSAVDDPGADEFIGGGGSDTMNYGGRTSGVTVSLDDVANDGAPNEGDNVHSDIETLIGSPKDDTLTGSPYSDTIHGGDGSDTIHGGDGNDTVTGDSGNDFVYGDGGDDDVEGNDGNDTVDGGTGRDTLFGDSQNCSLAVSCATGNDAIFARDGELDSITCGLGADTAQVDAIDVVSTDPIGGCESIDRAAATSTANPGSGPGANAGASTITATPSPFTAIVNGKPSAAKGVSLTITCTTACSITASLGLSKSNAKKYKLGTKAVSIGTAKSTLLAAGSKKLTVSLTKAAKKKLAKVKKLSVTITITAKNAAGTSTSTTQTLTLKK